MQEKLLQTSRIYVTRFEQEDLPEFHEMESDPEVMRFTSSGQPYDFTSNQSRLSAIIQSYNLAHPILEVFAVKTIDLGNLIGSVALEINKDGKHEIGYRLLRKFWGLGFGQEMADYWIEYLFLVRKTPILEAYAFVDNKASVRILDRSILQLKSEFFNESYDLWDRYYALSLEEFLAKRSV
jgi:ribosomal-protein-alanine N-acetyltransferase